MMIVCVCMLYYCNMVRRAWWDWELSGWLTTLLQCFDTVGWVIRPKTLSVKWPVMYQVGCWTLVSQSINQSVPGNRACLLLLVCDWGSWNDSRCVVVVGWQAWSRGGRDSMTRNLYITSRMFWCDDASCSNVCWGSCDPQFNFSQVISPNIIIAIC